MLKFLRLVEKRSQQIPAFVVPVPVAVGRELTIAKLPSAGDDLVLEETDAHLLYVRQRIVSNSWNATCNEIPFAQPAACCIRELMHCFLRSMYLNSVPKEGPI